MKEGLFIVLEGVDGAGTTTQSLRLQEKLQAKGVAAQVTQEPSKGPVGMLLRLVLSGRIVVPLAGAPGAPSWTTLALMFAADRMDHLEAEVLPLLKSGVTVISDRYYHSSIAYQSCTGGSSVQDLHWIKEINSYARRPDLSIVLDVSPEVALDRRRARGSAELYDQIQLQRDLCAFYRELGRYLERERIVSVDGNASFEEVANAVFAEVEPLTRDLRGRG
jgi:dTMP kinase